MGILLTATLITRTPTYCTCGTLVGNYEQEPYQKGLDTKGEQPCRLCPVAINKWMKIWVKNNGSYTFSPANTEELAVCQWLLLN